MTALEDRVVGLVGDLDTGTIATVKADILGVVEVAGGPIVLDLRQVRFVDSTGLGALIAIAVRAREQGVPLVLRHPPSQLLRLMSVTQTYGEFRWG